jgi:hypothetical protein
VAEIFALQRMPRQEGLMMDHALSPVAAQPDGGDFIVGEADTRSVEELEEEIAELCTHIDAATYRLLRAIAEFDRREAWGVGFPSTAHWLSWRVGIDLVTAREKVRVARALEGLPRISEAFRQGKVSYSKVRAITRIGSPDNEEYLLYIAENGTACHMEALVRAWPRKNNFPFSHPIFGPSSTAPPSQEFAQDPQHSRAMPPALLTRRSRQFLLTPGR